MADFPRIAPNEINFDAGVSNISEVSTFAGPIRFRHSNRINGHTLQLTYRGLSQTQIEAIRNHYVASDGVLRRFNVPSDLWGGLAVVPETAEYRYLEPPQEEHLGLYYNITISLKILEGSVIYFILDCDDATLPVAFAFSSIPFVGTAPFILDCEDAGPAPALILEGGGAKL